MIPKRLIRIGWDNKPMPEIFERWWREFQMMHPGWEFVTLYDEDCKKLLPDHLRALWLNASCYAARSDITRYVAVWKMGGIYVDTDVMPIKPMDVLLHDSRPFAAKRSSASFESAIFGGPAYHPAFTDLLNALPAWYHKHEGRYASVQTGPAFFSSVLFGRKDVRHLPMRTFYPYNGFMPPSRDKKQQLFEQDRSKFPPEMLCAHFSNQRWGGKPKK
jgi:mannosyltransferase OCH1-like enzyme